jgi:hypothetical protein
LTIMAQFRLAAMKAFRPSHSPRAHFGAADAHEVFGIFRSIHVSRTASPGKDNEHRRVWARLRFYAFRPLVLII